MKQVYLTSPAVDSSGVGGELHVRAASPGINPDRLAYVPTYAGYVPPAGLSPETAAKAPVRLTLMNAPGVGRMVCYCTWTPNESPGPGADAAVPAPLVAVGVAAETGETESAVPESHDLPLPSSIPVSITHERVTGRVFAHVLLDVPGTLDAQHVIQTWGSPLWRRGYEEHTAELPEMLYLPMADAISTMTLREFLLRPASRELLQFVLSAVLMPNAPGRVFIAAPPETVAVCVYAITCALPLSLVEDLSFSTYEHNPLQSQARITGTSFVDGSSQDLPEECYTGMGLAFNTYTARHSALPRLLPFAEYAVEAMVTGKTGGLDEFRNAWQRLGIRETGLLDIVFRMARGTGTLTKEESSLALQNSALATWIASRPDALQQFLDWALEDIDYTRTSLSRVVVALRQRPDALQKLAQTARARGLAALKQGDRLRTANALEAILPMMAPSQAASVWGDLINEITDPDSLSWEIRWYLLPQLVHYRNQTGGQVAAQTVDPTLLNWLRIPEEQLAAVLSLDLPRRYQLAASLSCLEQPGQPTALLARTVARQPALAILVMERLLPTPDGEAKVTALFDLILTEAPQHPWIEDMVQAGKSLPQPLLERCLDGALKLNRVDIERLIRVHGNQLTDLLDGRPMLERVVREFLAISPADLVTDTALRDLIGKLAHQTVFAPEVTTRLQACVTIHDFLQQPSTDSDRLGTLATALAQTPPLMPTGEWPGLVRKLGAEIGTKAGSPEVQTPLEELLLRVGPFYPEGPPALYRSVLRERQDDRGFWKQTELLHAFLAVALGAIKSGQPLPGMGTLEAEAYTLALMIAKNGKMRTLKVIDEKAQEWDQQPRAMWNYLSKAVKPRGLKDTMRDVMIFAAGAVVAAAVGAVLKVAGVI